MSQTMMTETEVNPLHNSRSTSSESWTQPNLSECIALRLKRLAACNGSVKLQVLERAMCAVDVVHFINTWGWTYDPRRSPSNLPFILFPRQAEYLVWRNERVRAREHGLVEKSRDVGMSWLNLAWQVWRWLFTRGYKGTMGSRKQDLVDKLGDPDSLFEKARMFLRMLPVWMLPVGRVKAGPRRGQAIPFNEKKHAGLLRIVNPENGSVLTGEGGDNMGRGGRSSVYDVDEAAFLERAMRVDAAISNNSDVIIYTSTPNGTSNPFYKKRMGGKVHVFTLHWTDDPRKGPAWYVKMQENLDPITVAQEIDIDYNASVDGVVVLKAWVDGAIRRGPDGLYKGERGAITIGCDVARFGSDKSAAVVREGRNLLWAEEWQGHDTTGSVDRLVAIGKDCEWMLREGAGDRLYFLIDTIGVGAGVADGLRKWIRDNERVGKWQVVDVQVGEKSPEEKCFRLRDALWWRVRQWFEKELPVFDVEAIAKNVIGQLAAELSAPTYDVKDEGLVVVESKKQMKKRGVPSPNLADALIHTFHWEACKPDPDTTPHWLKPKNKKRGLA